MTIKTTTMANYLATEYGAKALYGALYTTTPTSTQGTEVTGGFPAYARKALTWGTATSGVVTATATFDVPACTVVGAGIHSASTGGTYLDGGTVTSQVFSTQGLYVLTLTFTQS